jgi:hypothetical protein
LIKLTNSTITTREANNTPTQNATQSTTTMNRRSVCVFETTRSWYLHLDGQERDVTARWEGILRGKLVVLVDGKLTDVCKQDHDVPTALES